MKSLILITLLVALCAAVPTQLSYTIGTNYVYNVTGVVQNNGYDTSAQEFVPGYYSTMVALMAMQPVQEDETSYLFVMNLFGTVVSVSSDNDNSTGPDPSQQPLGEDVYFTQLKTGEIVEIQYYSDDPIYYVNVKVSAINAFQTSIVGVGAVQNVLESDPVGNHTAQVTGAAGADGSLLLTKEFSQTDFSAFPDPTVTPQNMYIDAQAITGVHADGYIMSSNLNQVAILTSGAPSQSKRGMTNSTGLDMDLSAVGTLSVQYIPPSAQFSSMSFSAKSSGYVTTGMFDLAAKAAVAAKEVAATRLNIQDDVNVILSKESVKLSMLTKIGNHFKYNPQDIELLAPIFGNHMEDATIRDRAFFVVTVARNEEYLIKYGLLSKNCEVVGRAILAAAQFKPASHYLTSLLLLTAKKAECPFAQEVARNILSPRPPKRTVTAPSDFPFNKSLSEAITLGGKIAAVDFAVDLFAGTNFNCKNTQFNYEAYAEASATAILFGYSQQAFDAKVIYGQANGAPLADQLSLSIWGNVIYSHDIPTLNCDSATYPLAHAAPGFNVEHTLWVSIIPITFSASASLDLTATWGWSICPTTLTADVDVSGDGTIELSGSTFTDLLLLRAGFDLDGSLNTNIIPEVFVQGTLCEVGFEVDANNDAQSASFTSYYEWRECKFLFFDCKWGKHNEQTWWTWSEPAKDYVLFKETYQIGA